MSTNYPLNPFRHVSIPTSVTPILPFSAPAPAHRLHPGTPPSSKDPSQPEHATKNHPDKDQPADVARGQTYVENLGLANARDIIKMLQWNNKYGIKFMRLSGERFPFASHEEHGYKLAPFAAEIGRASWRERVCMLV